MQINHRDKRIAHRKRDHNQCFEHECDVNVANHISQLRNVFKTQADLMIKKASDNLFGKN